jgi:uncharacterized protein (TIGR03089 family)
VDALLRALVASDPGRPRVTWYGPGGERVELSGRVLANWVAKTANLLVEECGVAPGSTVELDLPPHWRTVVFALATWSVGATVGNGGSDVLVTVSPPADGGGRTVVAVALPALARRFEATPDDGSWDVDYAAEVSGFADEPLYGVDDDPAGVLSPARTTQVADGARALLLSAGWGGPDAVLPLLVADGSVVLVGDPDVDLQRLARSENVTDGA